MKLYILLISFIFFAGIVSANGLNIGITNVAINKTYNTPIYINFTISNDEAFAFYNISSDNAILSFDQIPVLNPNSNVSVVALINTNIANNYTIRIKGVYDAPLGVSNRTYNVNVDYNNGISNCDISAIQGDKVIFQNSVLDSIVMMNVDTSVSILTIPMNTSTTLQCNYPQNIRYNFQRRGFVFTSTCNFYCLNDTGKINNPQYDAVLSLALNINFNATQISTVISVINYTINNYQSSDGVITITNNGSYTAKNIQLNSNGWISFNQNNFDLEPGQTKGLIYTVSPVVTSTNSTNQTYIKTISIVGNFNEFDQNVSIFVPYMFISGNSSSTYPSIIDIIQQYCVDYPADTLCLKTPVYINGSTTDQTFNVTYSQQQVKQLQDYQFAQGDSLTIFQNWVKEHFAMISDQMNNVTNSTLQSAQDIAKLRQEKEDSQNLVIFLISAISFILIAGLLVALIYVYKQKRTMLEVNRY